VRVLLDVAVCLPKEAETVSLIRTVVRHGLDTFGIAEDCIDDICLALSEACTNVVEHAAVGDEYEVRLQFDEWVCAISVKNTGEGFDASALQDVMPSPASPRGRGVAIMRSVMDRADFDSEPADGTIVNLVKNLEIDPDGPLSRLRRKPSRRRDGAALP
jgi:serine/threonine-protein kinase RsbW